MIKRILKVKEEGVVLYRFMFIGQNAKNFYYSIYWPCSCISELYVVFIKQIGNQNISRCFAAKGWKVLKVAPGFSIKKKNLCLVGMSCGDGVLLYNSGCRRAPYCPASAPKSWNSSRVPSLSLLNKNKLNVKS